MPLKQANLQNRVLPVPPVVGTLGVLLIIHIIVGHQQVFAFQLVFVVIIHVGTDAKTVIWGKKTLILHIQPPNHTSDKLIVNRMQILATECPTLLILTVIIS